METICGGLNCDKVNSTATKTLALCLCVASLAGGPVGWICAPSAIGLSAAALMC
ncbi:hypothetical protein [uncultured Dysgonomonas sp.]|uniref:hypothetical protein n=1 Tax=uncultured Dysgonomonas sp. TaxID=206096 RepID=UPI002804F943|nr:hypothetical protein [uncultured Dysgonomonas sp.]